MNQCCVVCMWLGVIRAICCQCFSRNVASNGIAECHHSEETIHCFAIHLHTDENRFVTLMETCILLYENIKIAL